MCTGSDRPKLKDIHHHVVQQAAHKWRDVGVSLEVAYLKMEMIAADHPRDDVRCFMSVLDTWLMNTPDASWNQLISALRSPTVQLEDLYCSSYSLLQIVYYIMSILIWPVQS